MNFILLGPPGSGKGTQGEYLEKKAGVVRISTGDLLREEVKQQTEIGKQIKHLIESGQFATDDIVITLTKNRITELADQGFILDGFPRNVEQAQWLDLALKEIGIHIDFVMNFNVPDLLLIERITSRYFCATCKATYNKLHKNPKKEGICDVCGGKEFLVRADDKVETVKKRLQEYNAKTLPLVEYYKGSGILCDIDASGDIKDIRKKIDSLLSKSR